jgi:replicative DNA helicase
LDGGPALSDYLLIQAFTNSGKTWIASHIAVHAWKVGRHGVLHYSPEISKQQQEDRNDTLLGHYNNVQLRNGTLTNEDEYFTFLDGFQEDEVPYLIKTMEDLQEGLSLDVIEADLQLNPNIKVVLIDGFSLMDHGKGDTSSMAKTSRRLRQIFGKYNVLGIVVNQVSASSEKEKGKEKQEDGTTLPNPAGLLGFSSTSAVIQDAAHVLSFDAVNGYGQLYIPKTRGTGKEAVVDLNCNFNSGFITEASPVDHF